MIASARLFGLDGWLADREAAIKLGEALQAGSTAVGNEVNVDLHIVFMGLCKPWEMVDILEQNGLLDEDEGDALFDLFERDEKHYEPPLKARVQQAYRSYHKATVLH